MRPWRSLQAPVARDAQAHVQYLQNLIFNNRRVVNETISGNTRQAMHLCTAMFPLGSLPLPAQPQLTGRSFSRTIGSRAIGVAIAGAWACSAAGSAAALALLLLGAQCLALLFLRASRFLCAASGRT